MKRFIIFMFLVFFGFSTTAMAQTIKDAAGNSYSITRIGDQLWMAENLRTTKGKSKKGGNVIAIQSLGIAKTSESPTMYWHDDSPESDNSKKYGPLYNWATVKDCDVCPEGWRIPSQDDWNLVLRNWYGAKAADGTTIEAGAKGLTYAAYQLREAGAIWPNNGKATNSTGFSARPGGWLWGGRFSYLGKRSAWWGPSSDPKNNNQTPFFAKIADGDNGTWLGEASLVDMLYIRCVKDNQCSGNIVTESAATTNVSFRGGDSILVSFRTEKNSGSFPDPNVTQNPQYKRTSGLSIVSSANDAFVLGRNGATDQSEMRLNWDAAPVVIGCDWTLRWKGDHVATLRDYYTKGQLKIGTLPTGQQFDPSRDIFYDQNNDFATEAYTYVGFTNKADFSKMIPFVGDESYGGVSQINVYGSAIQSASQPFRILFDTGSWETLIPYSKLDKSRITFVGSFKLTEAYIDALQLPDPTKTSLKTMKDQVFESQAAFEQKVQEVGVTLTASNKLPILEAAYQKVVQPWESERKCYRVRGQLAFKSEDGTTTYSVDDYEFYAVEPGAKVIMGAFPSPQPWDGIKSFPYALAEKYPTAGRVGFGIITSPIDKSYLMVKEDPNIDFTNLNWRTDIPLWQDPAKIPFAPEATPGFKIKMKLPEGKHIESPSLMATIDTGAPEVVLRLGQTNPQDQPAYSNYFSGPGFSWWPTAKGLRHRDGVSVIVEFTDSAKNTFCYTFVPWEDRTHRDRQVAVGPWDGDVPWRIGLPDKPRERFNLGNTLYRNCPVFFYDITGKRVGFSFE